MTRLFSSATLDPHDQVLLYKSLCCAILKAVGSEVLISDDILYSLGEDAYIVIDEKTFRRPMRVALIEPALQTQDSDEGTKAVPGSA